ERVVGDLALDLGINQNLFMATKVWTSGREAGITQMNQSMAYMQANPMDLIQVHNMLDCQTHLKTLRQWKEEGKVRYIGITHYTDSAHPELIRWIKRESLDFVQFNYSLFNRNAEKELLPLCQEKGVATLINLPFGAGQFLHSVIHKPLPSMANEMGCQTWGQFLLKYILGHPAVTCVIPGTSNPGHLLDNLKAGESVLPTENQREEMRGAINSF
ncbi:MAG: aldo/keto reductase, partial [Bacteroidetes bacterium]|nr:aldo/keto reductase [Bacteroidota bacterium]